MPRTKDAELDVNRLVIAMRRSRWMLERFRVNRREMVRQDAGARYSEEGTRETVPVNLIGLYKSIVGRSLISNNPRFLLSTFNRQAKPVVKAEQSFANEEVKRIQLKSVLKRVVIDALFSIGICKVALATPSDAAKLAWKQDAGRAFVANVDLDDYVVDSHARDRGGLTFEGHRYRVPLDSVKDDSKLYGPARKTLNESYDPPFNVEGDERIHKIGQGYREMQTEEYEPHVDLWEVYLPRHRLIVTLADEWMAGGAFVSGGEPLRVQRWIGPDTGPYHILGLGTIPGNLMPQGPLQTLFELHLSANETMRKIIRTVKRIKELTLYDGNQSEDAARVQQYSDGDLVPCRNPQNLNQVVFGGNAIQQLTTAFMLFKQLFNEQAGNLEMMGGLAPQSKTAHQDEMLNQNSSRTLTEMQDETVTFVSEVGEALCWYWHHDPQLIQKTVHSLPGLPQMQVPLRITPDARQRIPFDQLQIKVDPYSMAHATPESRMAALDQVVQQVLIPMQAMLQQQGIFFDLNVYLQKAAQYRDMPDLSELITIREPPQQGQGTPGGANEAGPAAPNTSRTYNRVSMPGRTQQGNDMNLMSSLMGVNPGGAGKNGTPAKPMGG